MTSRAARPSERARVVVIAYACRPDAGSELGAGWGIVSSLQRNTACTVVCSDKDADALGVWLAANPHSDLEIEVVAEGRFGRALHRPRLLYFVAYLLWLRRVERVLPSLVDRLAPAVVWHATFSPYWLPTPLRVLEATTVWGPVGGAVTTPASLRALMPRRARASDRLDELWVRLSARRPAVRSSWSAVTVLLAQNPQTAGRLEGRSGEVPVVNHSLGVDLPTVQPSAIAAGRAVWIGKVEVRKGLELALRALVGRPVIELVVVGDGPDRARLERVASELGVGGRVQWLGARPRHESLSIVAGAAAAVFTGLHEEGGLALAEALLLGTPTAVVAHGGADVIAANATDPSFVRRVRVGSVEHTAAELGDALTGLIAGGRSAEPLLDQAGFCRDLAYWTRPIVSDSGAST